MRKFRELESTLFSYWKKEYDYIVSVPPFFPGDAFNNSPLCFLRYVDMQASEAAKHGFQKIADDLNKFVTSNFKWNKTLVKLVEGDHL